MVLGKSVNQMVLIMKSVFLDRDGTIGGTGGGIHPFKFSMYKFSLKSLKALNELGLKVFLFTNQTRVGRGFLLNKNYSMDFN